MRIAYALPALVATFLATSPPAIGAESAKPQDKSEKKAKDDGGLFGSADNVVPLPVVIAPVIAKDYLATHLYMFLAAVTPSAQEAKKVKEKMPYILDALILDLYKNIVVVPTRSAEPDYAQIVERFKTTINRVMGYDAVSEIKVGRIDTSPY